MRHVVLLSATLAFAFAGWVLGGLRMGHSNEGASSPIPASAVITPAVTSAERAEERFKEFAAQMEEIKSMRSGTHWTVMLAKLAVTLKPEDFPIAIRAAEANGSMSTANLMEYWVERDYAAAKAWALSLTAAGRSKYLAAVAVEWAQREPKSLLDWIESFSGSERRAMIEAAMPALLAYFGKVETERALALVKESERPNVITNRVPTFYEKIAAFAPEDAAARAMKMAPGTERTLAVCGAIRQWAAKDPSAARAYLESISEAQIAAAALAPLAEGWAKKDPRAAVEFLAAAGQSASAREVLPKITREWTKRDPKAVLAWLDSGAGQGLDYDAHQAVFEEVVDQNAEEGIKLILERQKAGLTTSYNAIHSALFSIGYSMDEASAFKRLEELAAGKGIEESMAVTLAGHISRRFRERTAQWALGLADGSLKYGAVARIASQMRVEPGIESVEWVATLPQNPAYEDVRRDALFQKLGHFPERVLPYYERMLGAQGKDVLKEHIYSLVHYNHFQKLVPWLKNADVFNEAEIRQLLTPPKQSQ